MHTSSPNLAVLHIYYAWGKEFSLFVQEAPMRAPTIIILSDQHVNHHTLQQNRQFVLDLAPDFSAFFSQLG